MELSGGAGLTCVTTGCFKRTLLRLALVLPLGGPDAANRAALPHILRRGSAKLLDICAIGAKLDELYGARINAIVRLEGENLIIGFISDCIDEQYAPDSEGLTSNIIRLLTELLLEPSLRDGVFLPDYVSGERDNLLDRIAAKKNDPRIYVVKRLTELMCENERYGNDILGTEEQAKAITVQGAYEAYRRALGEARIELFFCGSMQPEIVAGFFDEAFQNTPLLKRPFDTLYVPHTEVLARPMGEVREITEDEKVTQGKLALGFRTGGASLQSGDPVAYWMFQTIYGGSTSAKLFINVREKKSLCYYANAQFLSHKGLLIVSSGIESRNYETAKAEILRQLSLCQEGDITDAELDAARATLRNGWRAALDDPRLLESYWQSQSVAGTFVTPEERISKLDNVTKEQVVECAEATVLDTIYFMKGVGK